MFKSVDSIGRDRADPHCVIIQKKSLKKSKLVSVCKKVKKKKISPKSKKDLGIA